MAGILHLVSLGPGGPDHITQAALDAVAKSDVIVSYAPYLKPIEDHLRGKTVICRPLGEERERALEAMNAARHGQSVSLISNGDIGVYGMACLAFELFSETDTFDITVIPGVTAATACGAVLGAPVSHDFATLSLSDLLIPWDTIEHRAMALASAGIVTVLYNVQSAKRGAGIYKIIDIFLEHRATDTICGVVRHAMRSEQQHSIVSLGELKQMTFDMHTSIIIGNDKTKRKAGFMYTKRGYEHIDDPHEDIPSSALWVFAGTSDGNALAHALRVLGTPIVVSCATDHGAETAKQSAVAKGRAELSSASKDVVFPRIKVLSAKWGRAHRKKVLSDKMASCIVDATHPHAHLISEQLISLAQELHIPYVRYERPDAALEDDCILYCDGMEQAASLVTERRFTRVFLATGSKDLSTFLSHPNSEKTEWFVRILPEASNIQNAFNSGLPLSNICAMQGPFSAEFNRTLWNNWKIDCVVTKDSGREGGLLEKVEAAKALSLPLVVVRRPRIQYPAVSSSFQNVIQTVKEFLR